MCLLEDKQMKNFALNPKVSRLLLCDLDGTLTTPKSGQWPKNYSDQKPISGVSETLTRFKSDGYAIAIVSNQGGIEAGHKTVYQTCLQMQYVLSLFPQIEVAYFSAEDNFSNKPWHQKLLHKLNLRRNDCYWVTREDAGQVNAGQYVEDWHMFNGGNEPFVFRKPHAGMLFVAMSDFCRSTVGSVIMTGDRPEDRQASEMMGAFCQFIPADEFVKQ